MTGPKVLALCHLAEAAGKAEGPEKAQQADEQHERRAAATAGAASQRARRCRGASARRTSGMVSTQSAGDRRRPGEAGEAVGEEDPGRQHEQRAEGAQPPGASLGGSGQAAGSAIAKASTKSASAVSLKALWAK